MRGSLLTACCYLIGSLCFISGCTSGDADYKEVDKNGTENTADSHGHDDHGHGHEHAHGPHDGHVIELGDEEYHAELVFDASSKTVGVYLYGPDLKTPSPISEMAVTLKLKLEGKSLQLSLPAAPLEGESDGKSSYFEVSGNADISEHVHDLEELHGKLQLTIDGKQYVGDILHDHDHGEGSHEHGEGEHDHKDGDHGDDKK